MTADLVARLERCAEECDVYSPDVCGTLIEGIGNVAMRALLREAASALRSSGEAVEPHCSGHERFDYDCIDCSDALERKRKGNAPGDGTYPMKASGEAVVRGGSWIHEVAGKMVQDHYDNSGTLLSRIPFLHGLDGMDDALAFPTTPASAWSPIEELHHLDSRVVLFCDARGNRWTQTADCRVPVCGLPPTLWQELPPPPASTKQPAASAALESV